MIVDPSPNDRVSHLIPVVEEVERLCNELLAVPASNRPKAAEVHNQFAA